MSFSKDSRGWGKSRETGQAVAAEEIVRNSSTTIHSFQTIKNTAESLEFLDYIDSPSYSVIRDVAVGWVVLADG